MSAVGAALRVLRGLAVLRVRSLLPASVVDAVGRQLRSMPEQEAARVASVVCAAVPGVAVAGGWGIEALGARRPRRHFDLDLVSPTELLEPALRALAEIGYQVSVPSTPSGWWSLRTVVLRDDARNIVELIEVGPDGLAELARRAGVTSWSSGGTAPGSLAGISVRCLSAAVQLVTHQGYRLKRAQRRDMSCLRSLGSV